MHAIEALKVLQRVLGYSQRSEVDRLFVERFIKTYKLIYYYFLEPFLRVQELGFHIRDNEETF